MIALNPLLERREATSLETSDKINATSVEASDKVNSGDRMEQIS